MSERAVGKQVVVWEYNRRPGTELHDGHIQILTDTAKAAHGEFFEEFFGATMTEMLGALHCFLQRWPRTMVHVSRRQPESKFHKERVATTTMPEELVVMIRDDLAKASEYFRPIEVRSEEDPCQQ